MKRYYKDSREVRSFAIVCDECDKIAFVGDLELSREASYNEKDPDSCVCDDCNVYIQEHGIYDMDDLATAKHYDRIEW